MPYIRKRFTALIVFILVFTFQTAVFASDIEEIREILQEGYYQHVSQQVLEKATIDEILAALNDPYTEFFTKQEFDDFKKSIDMNYVGIGIIGEQHEQGVKVVHLFDTGGAINSDLKIDDIIVEADGTSLEGKTIDESQQFLLGNPGTTAVLKVFRSSINETVTIHITRKKTELGPTVESAWLGGNIGFVQLKSFNEDLVDELRNAIEDLEGVDGWIIDIRDNAGGYLDSAQDVAGLFPNVTSAVVVEGQDKQPKIFLSTEQDIKFSGPLIMLVNSESASAAEILAGAVKDQQGAKLYGQTTYGKGLAQSVIMLSSGNMFKMTVAQFYTPKGNVINHIGVPPDLETEIGEELTTAHRDLLFLASEGDGLALEKLAGGSGKLVGPVARNVELTIQLQNVIAADELSKRIKLIQLGDKEFETQLQPTSLTSFKIQPKKLLNPDSIYLLKIQSGTKDYVLEFTTSDKIDEKATAEAGTTNFADVKASDFFANPVAVLANEGIVKGLDDGRFGPNSVVTREQAAVFFARVLDLDTSAQNVGTLDFKDVKKSDYFYTSVAAVNKAGIMHGQTKDNFGTGTVLTRGEMAALLARAFALQATGAGVGAGVGTGPEAGAGADSDVQTGEHFADITTSPFAADILKIYQNGIASGTAPATFSPKKAVTRGEFSTFLYRAIVKQKSGSELIIESVK